MLNDACAKAYALASSSGSVTDWVGRLQELLIVKYKESLQKCHENWWSKTKAFSSGMKIGWSCSAQAPPQEFQDRLKRVCSSVRFQDHLSTKSDENAGYKSKAMSIMGVFLFGLYTSSLGWAGDILATDDATIEWLIRLVGDLPLLAASMTRNQFLPTWVGLLNERNLDTLLTNSNSPILGPTLADDDMNSHGDYGETPKVSIYTGSSVGSSMLVSVHSYIDDIVFTGPAADIDYIKTELNHSTNIVLNGLSGFAVPAAEAQANPGMLNESVQGLVSLRSDYASLFNATTPLFPGGMHTTDLNYAYFQHPFTDPNHPSNID